MKHLFVLIMLFACLAGMSQGVKISAAPGSPDASSIFEVESNQQGFLPPRMTDAERDAIQNPATGLTIFNTTTNCTNVFNGSSWYALCGICLPEILITSQPQDSEVCPGNPASFSVTAAGNSLSYQWQVSTDNGNTWNDISDNSSYSGTQSSGLSITGITIGQNAERYRVAVSGSCPTVYSHAALLSVSTLEGAGITGDNSICANESTVFTAVGGTSFLWNTGAVTASITVSEAGEYSVTISDNLGCSVTDGETLVVTSLPPAANAGPDQSGVSGTVTLAGNNPSPASGAWTIESGSGGSFTNASLYNTTFTGTEGQEYVLRWTISNACGSSNDDVSVSFLPPNSCGTVTDVDGNTYFTVQIGTQCWMRSNLKTKKYRNNSVINNGNANWPVKPSGNTPSYTDYNQDPSNTAVYGLLYNWYAVNSANGLCPTGWHVPSRSEFSTMTTFLGGLSVAGGAMKEAGTSHWNSPNTGATNSSGFTGLPAGWRGDANEGIFYSLGNEGLYWTSTFGPSGMTTTHAYYVYTSTGSASAVDSYTEQQTGYSVRCLKD